MTTAGAARVMLRVVLRELQGRPPGLLVRMLLASLASLASAGGYDRR